MMNILVFKTNLSERHLPLAGHYLSRVKGIYEWDFDLEDADRIMRVKVSHASARDIETTLHQAGYECTELED